jgi:predicted secreted protein
MAHSKKAVIMAALMVVLFAGLALPVAAQAACPDGSTPPPGIPCAAPVLQNLSIYTILNSIVSILFYVLMFAAIIMILIGAFNFLTAGGDQEKVGKARSAIVYAVIAIVIAVLARSVPFIIRTFVVSNVQQSSTPTLPGF